MYVVELVAEGLQGFAPRIRLGFRGKLDVLRLESSDARRAIADVFFHTLFPDPDRTQVTADLVRSDARTRRAVLTLAGSDRVPYRLLRDLGTGKCRLYRFDRTSKSHTVISQEAREAQQFLRVQHQIPDDASYERLFLFSADGRPSLGVEARSRTGAPVLPELMAPSGPGLPAASFRAHSGLMSGASLGSGISELPQREITAAFPLPSVLGDTGVHQAASGFSMNNVLVQQELEASGTADILPESTDEQLFDRYRSLLTKRRRAKRVARAERTLDALMAKETSAELVLSEVRPVERALEEVEAAIEADHALHNLPPGFEERLQRHEEIDARHRAERDRINAEVDSARQSIHEVPPVRPLHRDPWLWLGVGGAVGSAASSVLLGVPWLAIGQAVFGTVAGMSALRGVATEAKAAENQARLEYLEDRAMRAERQHKLDTSAVRGHLAQLGMTDARELLERLATFDRRVAERDRLRAELKGHLGRRGQRAREVIRKVAEHKSTCEEILARYASETDSLQSIERRLQSLEAEIQARGRSLPVDEESSGVLVVKGTADLPPLTDAPSRPQSLLMPIDDLDEDDSDGYGDGYGSSTSSSGGDGSSADAADGEASGYHLAGSFPGARGGSLVGGGYGGGGSPGPDRSRQLVETAADLMGQEFESLLEAAAPRVGQFAKVVTHGHFQEARFDGHGRLIVEGASGSSNYGELEGTILDQVDSALRFALLEMVVKIRRVPIMIEEPYAVLPPDRRDISRRIYNYLAGLTQVVVLTPADDLGGHSVVVEA